MLESEAVPLCEPSPARSGRVKLVPKPQQVWQTWNDVPESAPEEFMHARFFVEVFAGKAWLSRSARRRTKLAVLPAIEIEFSKEVQGKADILDHMVRRELEAWIRAGVVKFVHFGAPMHVLQHCSTK